MADDGEVLRQIWDSQIPVSFHLSPNDQYSIKNPEPYYLMVSRMSYFSLLFDKISVYFSQFIDSSTKSAANMWLDFLGTPLRLNYPIGLLFELFRADIEPPWALTVNFDRFPNELLVKCNTRPSMESTFMSCLKEADAIKHRNPIVSVMQKKDHNQLWTSLMHLKFDQFWSINRRLMVPDNAENLDHETHYFRHIPFRLYIISRNNDSPVFHQKLVKPVLPDGEAALFRDLLTQMLPADAIEKYRFTTHGIEPSLDTPLQWMSEHLSYLDNFLHITAFDKT